MRWRLPVRAITIPAEYLDEEDRDDGDIYLVVPHAVTLQDFVEGRAEWLAECNDFGDALKIARLWNREGMN